MGGIFKYTLFLMLFIALALTFGCAEKHKDVTQDFQKAESAIQAAQAADATTYAPLDLRLAEDKLSEAQTAKIVKTTTRRKCWRTRL